MCANNRSRKTQSSDRVGVVMELPEGLLQL